MSRKHQANAETGGERRLRRSVEAIVTAMCAALYAAGSYATAYIPSPLGFGQFRPAVVIPAFFATIFGPMPAAVGAAIGTLLADSLKHGMLYMGSLVAAVPGNFIGFYHGGRIVRRYRGTRFILANLLVLAIGNAITAFSYVIIFKAIYVQALPFSPGTLTLISLGLTLYWFITMLPFVLLVTPLLIRAAAHAMPSIVPEDVYLSGLKSELPKKSFSLAMTIPGILMVIIGLATTFTPLGTITANAAKLTSTILIELMYYLGGITLITIGLITAARK
ncbi:MAG: hypothetical protein DRN65_02395 [Thaumarchaeota archaeon]|nr:MAG: hypothetical protein DRN65_02395 [Nitrososphaerota archaeon]